AGTAVGGGRRIYAFAVLLPSSARNSSVWDCWENYIGRIYNDVRARPRYFVQQVIYPESTPFTEESHQ
ncbi:undecaprenyl phosphate 4-deoxy-4-formamido-L-arabinose transferase, partial [Salmonella enterica subsp. enterica serovar Heidelberg str. 670102-3]